MLEIRSFRELAFIFEGESITSFPSRKAEALLVYLAVERETAHRRESLFTLLWPGMPEKSARHNLRQVLYALRQTFPEVAATDGDEIVPLLLADRKTVRINPQAAVRVDIHILDQLLEGTQVHDHLDLNCCKLNNQAMEQVVELYTGDFLSDFYLEDSNQFEDWVTAIRETFQRKVLETLQTLAEIAILNKNFELAKEYAERQLGINPLKESAHRQLMEILARDGQRAASLCQYRNCEEILKDELGIAPSTKTIFLFEQIRTESLPAPDAEESIPLTHPTPQNNLPHPLTSFVGREEEIEKITDLISIYRLVTLTGTGGIGKTQLGLHVGRRLLDAFPDGVWLIELAPVADPNLVPQTAAYALGLWESPNRPILDYLAEYLQDKHCLLILDNCEHLVTAIAQFTETLLHSCSEVKILVSSREKLGVPGEMSYLVPPLSFPDVDQVVSFEDWKQFDALHLFTERASTSLPGFQITKNNLTSLVQICQRLDGIPLALELAAARVQILPLEQIAARLDDRFQLLTSGSRTAPERQQTLWASIDWSWELLSHSEKALMQRLAVFAGGMNLPAVEAICAGDGIDDVDVLDLLTQLVNKSILIARREQGQETRYRLLETIRQYAQEQLAASGLKDKFCDRHLDYFRQWGEQAEEALIGPSQVAWLNQLEYELDNIREALRWALETDIEAGLQLAAALWQFWILSYLREGEAWISELLAHTDTLERGVKAKALWVQGRFYFPYLNNTERSRILLEQSLDLYRALGDQQGVGRCLRILGLLADDQSLLLESLTIFKAIGDKFDAAEVLQELDYRVREFDYGRAMAYRDECESLYREMGHLAGIAEILVRKAEFAIWQGDYEVARSMLEESLALRESLGMKGSSATFSYLGKLYLSLGEYKRARVYFEKSLSISGRSGDKFYNIWAWVHLGYVFLRMGEINQARNIFVKCLPRFKDVSQIDGVVFSAEGLASLAVSQRQAQKAARLIAWADATRKTIQDPRPPVEQADVEQEIDHILEMIGEKAYTAAYEEGKSMTMEQAIALAIKMEQTNFA